MNRSTYWDTYSAKSKRTTFSFFCNFSCCFFIKNFMPFR